MVKLFERQEMPLMNGCHSSVVTLDGFEIQKLILNVSLLGPKHTIRDKFTDAHLRADVEKLYCKFWENNTDGERL